MTSTQLPLALRDEVLDRFEVVRAGYLRSARLYALFYCRDHGSVTIEDVRRIFPPPDGVDPRLLGAVLRKPHFVLVGYESGTRKESHGRPIGRFRLP